MATLAPMSSIDRSSAPSLHATRQPPLAPSPIGVVEGPAPDARVNSATVADCTGTPLAVAQLMTSYLPHVHALRTQFTQTRADPTDRSRRLPDTKSSPTIGAGSPAPRLYEGNWLTQGSGTDIPDPVSDIVLDYLSPIHPLRTHIEPTTIDPKFRRPVTDSACTRRKEVTRAELMTRPPGTLFAFGSTTSGDRFWAVLRGGTAFRICVEVAGDAGIVNDRGLLAEPQDRDEVAGDTTNAELVGGAAIFLPSTPGFEPLSAEEMQYLPAGAKVIVGNWKGSLRVSDSPVVVDAKGTQLNCKLPAHSGFRDAPKLPRAAAPTDYRGQLKWCRIAVPIDTAGQTILPHPFYAVAAARPGRLPDKKPASRSCIVS